MRSLADAVAEQVAIHAPADGGRDGARMQLALAARRGGIGGVGGGGAAAAAGGNGISGRGAPGGEARSIAELLGSRLWSVEERAHVSPLPKTFDHLRCVRVPCVAVAVPGTHGVLSPLILLADEIHSRMHPRH